MSLLSDLIDQSWTHRAPSPLGLRRHLAVGRALIPGLTLTLAVALAAIAIQAVEQKLTGRTWLESLVLAILVGAGARTLWTPGERWNAGVCFSAKTLLEIAVVLLGASLSAATVTSLGLGLIAGIFALVALAIGASYSIGRALGLPARMALLVASGNSICGNSAIAAVAPVIGAKGEDVAASIAFTALLGVVTVLGLPLLGHALGMNAVQFGVLSGLTVYAVPQVLAAAAPMGASAVHIGTFVKLVRVLMLGPVCFAFSLLAGRLAPEPGAPLQAKPASVPLGRLVPWFILGFLALAAARSLNLIPTVALPPIAAASGVLTIISMAALGLMTDLRAVAKAGARVAGSVTVSLLVLGGLSLGLIRLLHIA